MRYLPESPSDGAYGPRGSKSLALKTRRRASRSKIHHGIKVCRGVTLRTSVEDGSSPPHRKSLRARTLGWNRTGTQQLRRGTGGCRFCTTEAQWQLGRYVASRSIPYLQCLIIPLLSLSLPLPFATCRGLGQTTRPGRPPDLTNIVSPRFGSSLHQRDSRSALFEGYNVGGSGHGQRPVSASPSRVGGGYGYGYSPSPGANGRTSSPGLGAGGFRSATPNKK